RASVLFYLSDLFSISDEEAMRRVQKKNDSKAFALLIHRWEPWAKQFCTRFTGDRHLGEDLSQEVFARLFAHRLDFRHEARFGSYLKSIALNACRDELRRKKRCPERQSNDTKGEEASLDNTVAATTPTPDTIAAGRERAEHVRRALLQLREHYREVVVLRHYEGLRFREIAEFLDLAPGTVRSRMAEALTRLGTLLKPILHEGNPGLKGRHGSSRQTGKEML
ncbi:RNA polymerase sigma factor, partial [Planctomycetota bacterium]